MESKRKHKASKITFLAAFALVIVTMVTMICVEVISGQWIITHIRNSIMTLEISLTVLSGLWFVISNVLED